jgi:hypothetical protein
MQHHMRMCQCSCCIWLILTKELLQWPNNILRRMTRCNSGAGVSPKSHPWVGVTASGAISVA